jgi:hypothetical protein
LRKPTLEVLLNSSIGVSLRMKLSLSFSRTTRPRVPAISKRFVPGASPVEVMNVPVAPFGYSMYAVTSAHARRHPAKPLEGVEVVEALVEEDAAAFAFPGRAPAAAGVIGFGAEPIGDDPAHAGDVPEVAVLDEFLNLLITGFATHLEHAGKNEFFALGFFVRGDQALGVGFVRGNRFLDHDVEAMLNGGDAEGGVLIMRRGDEDGIKGAGADEFIGVAVNFEGEIFFEFVGRGAADGNEFAAVDFAGAQVFGVMFADVAHADDAQTDFSHGGS